MSAVGVAVENAPKENVSEENAPEAKSFDFAAALRWLGSGAVVLSGIVFLLQGFDDIALSLRNWAYLGLMIALSVVGIGLKYLFEDGKGARVLLGLAVAVIPIQFAQLGGMIHSLVVASAEIPSVIAGLVEFGSLGWGMVIATAGATVLLAVAVGFFGFRVLARPHAKTLVWVNVGLCAALLLPFREGALAIAVLALIGLATFVADRKLGRNSPVLRTVEGRGARLLLLLPFVIASVRVGFYISDVSGFAMLFGLVSSCLIVAATRYVGSSSLRELMLGLGALGVCAAWTVWSMSELSLSGVQQTLSLFAVEGIFLLAISSLSSHGMIYRLFGSMLFGFGAVQVVFHGYGMQAPVVTLSLGVLLAALGYFKRWQAPTMVGSGLVVFAIIPLTFQALGNVEFDTWLGLAIGGVCLVVLAAVVERYGRPIAQRTQATFSELKTWD